MAYTETKLTNLGHLKDLAVKAQAEIAAVKAKIPTNVSQLTNDAQVPDQFSVRLLPSSRPSPLPARQLPES